MAGDPGPDDPVQPPNQRRAGGRRRRHHRRVAAQRPAAPGRPAPRGVPSRITAFVSPRHLQPVTDSTFRLQSPRAPVSSTYPPDRPSPPRSLCPPWSPPRPPPARPPPPASPPRSLPMPPDARKNGCPLTGHALRNAHLCERALARAEGAPPLSRLVVRIRAGVLGVTRLEL